MIGRLRGRLDGRGENWVLVDVGGVGYMVEGSARLLDGCPPDGEAVSLAIETYVREDQFRLFGFLSEEERSWFKLLMGVQGLGPRLRWPFKVCCRPPILCRPWPPKTRPWLPRARCRPESRPAHCAGVERQNTRSRLWCSRKCDAGGPASQAHLDAMSALTNLGYQRAEAHRALQAATAASEDDEGESAETLIRKALKELAK